MDRQGLASAARRRLRSTEAGTLEGPAFGVSGGRTPFVLNHEGRPLIPAAPGLRAGDPARLRVAARRGELDAVEQEGLHVRTDRGVLYFAFDRLCAIHDDVHHATVHLARTARIALAKSGA